LLDCIRPGCLLISLFLTVSMLATSPIAAAAVPLRSDRANDIPSTEYTHAHALIAVQGGRRLNLFCMGSGSPTVIYEAGGGEDSRSFRRVQKRLSTTTRVCTYDRAGLGFSDPAGRPSTAGNIVDDLHRLIQLAPLSRPVVLIGHSSGGIEAMLYAATYPEDVAAMVLLDPSFVGQNKAITAAWTSEQTKAWYAEDADDFAEAKKCVALAREGKLSQPANQHSTCLDNPPDDDPVIHRLLNAQLARAAEQAALLSELLDTHAATANGLSAMEAALQNAHFTFGAKPLIVLTAADQFMGLPSAQRATAMKAWKTGHDQIAASSSIGRSILVEHSSHFIQADRPEVVVAAARKVVGDVRASIPAASVPPPKT
jgi:pimeloyl-ACP methyl ester carboxylesterase